MFDKQSENISTYVIAWLYKYRGCYSACTVVHTLAIIILIITINELTSKWSAAWPGSGQLIDFIF